METIVTSEGRTFDRFESRDNRRGNYPVEEVVRNVEPYPKTWTSRLVTDQGREGACVGHGLTTELVASPRPAGLGLTTDEANRFAYRTYKRAQDLDPWAGNAYEGTSVDAGFKAVRELGWIQEWRWMWTVDQIRDAVLSLGPVVLGVDWYDMMYRTRPSGLVQIGGSIVGGHCITIIGYHPSMRIYGEDWDARFEVFKWKNSWGTDYGKNGIGYITRNDLATLMAQGGDAATAIGRSKVSIRESLQAA